MKKIILVSAVAALASGSVYAGGTNGAATTPYYINVHGGLSIANNDDVTTTINGQTYRANDGYNAGYTLGGAVGYNFNPFRTEFALDYINNSRSGNDDYYTSVTTYMLNGYYDIDLGYKVTPYVGAGLGAATAHAGYADSSETYYQNDTQFAYKGIVGVSYDINDRLSTNLEYNYLGTSQFHFNNSEMDYGTNLFTVGLSYKI